MKLNIPKDQLLNPTPPRVFLCTTGKKRICELPATNRSLAAKWNSYGELQFEMQRTYVDLIDGETKVHPAYDKLEAPRNVLLDGVSYFALQDIDDSSGDNDIKNISAFSLEYATSNRYLTNWHINTGEVDSKEVLYNESQYGLDYNTDMDSFYKLASGEFDPYESYYQQNYTSTTAYTYEQVQINDAQKYNELVTNNSRTDAQPHEKLYMKKFANVQFYNPNKTGLSLLHLIFENIPEWKIGNVDQSLWRKERKFSESRISVYDFIQNNMHDTFGCVVIWDSLLGQVHFYEELEDDSEKQNEANTRFETDVFISKDNLASEVKVSYSSDNIKTKLVVTGSDNLNIREVNLGNNEIMDLSFYHTLDWMEQDLFDAYNTYLAALHEADTGLDRYGLPSTEYPMSYSDAMKGWVAANNLYTDLMNAIPVEGNVVLVGDEFKKLYCVYTPIYEEGATQDVINSAINNAVVTLTKKLNLYQVDEDTIGNKTDNILLRLKNTDGDTATIRVYDPKTKVKVDAIYDHNASYYIGKTSASGVVTYTEKRFSNATEFINQDKSVLYTNDYKVQTTIIRATSGLTDDPSTYDLNTWVRGDLTTDNNSVTGMNNLKGFSITYIGTMGAYFVLAKDEKQKENLEDYGVNLLKEKHQVYTTIFQAQTEAMLSQEGYQCTASDTAPTGAIADGARWLDTDSNPVELKAYDGDSKSWRTISASLSPEDQKKYEDYQRYIDNYEKLQAVQEVLFEKQREADYCINGHEVPDRVIDPSSKDGLSLELKMQYAALEHFKGHTVTRLSMNPNLPLYTFTTSFDPIKYGKNTKSYNYLEQYYVKHETFDSYLPVNIENQDIFKAYDGTTNSKTLYVITSGHQYAVYLDGTTPYVAYANSQGVYDMIMRYIRDKLEMNKFFTTDQWIRLSPFIKEDEFNDSNFLFTGYESEEERLKICRELMEAATKELKTLCKPSLSFSMTMANILALPEFEPLFNQFQLGNFIKVQIRDGYVKRARLLEVNMNFDDLSDFSCTFGNLITTKSEIDKHADLLKTAVSAGKQVAASSGSWQKAVDKTNKLEEDIANGLKDAAIAIGSASGQAISWDSTGMHFRKYKEGSTTEYEPEEMAIINNALVATNDSWQTSKSSFGKYYINGEERWGPIAEYVTAQTIEGKFISGGSIEIGEGNTKFIVNPDGSVEIRSGGTNYVDAMKEIDDAYRYRTIITYDKSTIFSDVMDDCMMTCSIYDYNVDITSKIISSGAKFSWIRTSYNGQGDADWNDAHKNKTTNTLKITTEDIVRNSTFSCNVEFDDSILTPEETTT